MKVGVFTALLANLSLDQVIEKLKGLEIDTVELGTGNYPGGPHCSLSMLDSKTALKDFKQKLDDNGISISALSCHGEPLHPDPAIAKSSQEVSRKTILLAEKLGVPVVVDFSGCPGDFDKAKNPNWVTAAWPPHFPDDPGLAVGEESRALLDEAGQVRRGSRREDRDRDASGLRGL